MNTSSQKNSRLHYLDSARAFALILGIVFHASISFMPIFVGWAVMDISTSSVVPTFMLISHSFRLELFFLIAGFFSHMKYHQDGAQLFLKSRTIRIGIPFVIGWILLRPLIVSAWIMGGESMQGDVNIFAALKTGFATLTELPKDLFIGTHLWFLYYLLLIILIVLIARFLVCLHNPSKQILTQVADAISEWICRSHLSIFVIAITTAGYLWFMNNWGVDTPDKSLIPHLPVLLVYGSFFLFGWLLHRQTNLLEQFASVTWSKLALCVLAVIATSLLSGFEMKHASPQYSVYKICFSFSYAIMMWSLVSLTIGLFKRMLDRPNKIVRYIADSSYWLYLIHLPIVIWLQIAFAELAMHWALKWGAVSVLTILISIVLYDIFVRSTFIGAVLNGKRKTRCLSLLGKKVKDI
ncbi:MAG: acyltransferase family protein [Kangiellaceae bacterium]